MHIKKIVSFFAVIIIHICLLTNTHLTQCAAAPLKLNTQEYSNPENIFKKLHHNKEVEREQEIEEFNKKPKNSPKQTDWQRISLDLNNTPPTIPTQHRNSKTLLMKAAQDGRNDIVQKLINRKTIEVANKNKPTETINIKTYINEADTNGNTALRWAMNAPEDKIMWITQDLLPHITNVDTQTTDNGRTPLHWLLRRHPNSFEKNLPPIKDKDILFTVAAMLLEKGANPLIPDKTGNSCLYWTLFLNDFELFVILLDGYKDYMLKHPPQKGYQAHITSTLYNKNFVLSVSDALFDSLKINTYQNLISALLQFKKTIGIIDLTLPSLRYDFLETKYGLTSDEVVILIDDLNTKISPVAALRNQIDIAAHSIDIQRNALHNKTGTFKFIHNEIANAIKEVQAHLQIVLAPK